MFLFLHKWLAYRAMRKAQLERPDESWMVQAGAHALMKLNPDSTIAECHRVSQQVFNEKVAARKPPE